MNEPTPQTVPPGLDATIFVHLPCIGPVLPIDSVFFVFMQWPREALRAVGIPCFAGGRIHGDGLQAVVSVAPENLMAALRALHKSAEEGCLHWVRIGFYDGSEEICREPYPHPEQTTPLNDLWSELMSWIGNPRGVLSGSKPTEDGGRA